MKTIAIVLFLIFLGLQNLNAQKDKDSFIEKYESLFNDAIPKDIWTLLQDDIACVSVSCSPKCKAVPFNPKRYNDSLCHSRCKNPCQMVPE